MGNPTEGQAVVVITVHREPSGDYWTEIASDEPVEVAVLVKEGDQVTYANDTAIDAVAWAMDQGEVPS